MFPRIPRIIKKDKATQRNTQRIIKQQFSLCPLCKNCIRNARHMENQHKVEVLEIAPTQEMWNAIKDYYEYQNKKQEKKALTKQVKR